MADAFLGELGIVRHAGQEDALAHEVHRAEFQLRVFEEALARDRHAQHLGQFECAFGGCDGHAERHEIGGQGQSDRA
jgi:hypothetical protein